MEAKWTHLCNCLLPTTRLYQFVLAEATIQLPHISKLKSKRKKLSDTQSRKEELEHWGKTKVFEKSRTNTFVALFKIDSPKKPINTKEKGTAESSWKVMSSTKGCDNHHPMGNQQTIVSLVLLPPQPFQQACTPSPSYLKPVPPDVRYYYKKRKKPSNKKNSCCYHRSSMCKSWNGVIKATLCHKQS